MKKITLSEYIKKHNAQGNPVKIAKLFAWTAMQEYSKAKKCNGLKKQIKKDMGKGKTVWLLNTPLHGNLGDQAIAFAEYKAFELMNLHNIVEITTVDYLEYKKIIKKLVKPEDVIFLHGGGNLGTLWRTAHDVANDIIANYPENKIVMFPQTIYYSQDDYGREKFEEDKKFFAMHRDLTLFLRDRASYDFCTENFAVKCNFVPDIVLILQDVITGEERKGLLTCYRTDFEKVLSDERIRELENYIVKNNILLKSTSTVIKEKIPVHDRYKCLYTIWKEFAQAELVITDRLHGMIFCAITNTPCIALDNISKKVSGVYQWIKDCEFIKFAENDFNVELIGEMMKQKHNCTYKSDVKKFEKLLTILENNKIPEMK